MPEAAIACGTCGRRLVPERIEPVLDPAALRRDAPAAPARPTSPRRPLPATGPKGPHPALRYLPNVLVGLGVVVAAAIYWSLSRDDALAGKAGAHRLAKSTGALATAQPATPAQPQFSARRALQGLYGNYDPVLDGAYWSVSGAPKALAEWNGKPVVIKPLISKTDEAATRHVLVTNSVDMRNGIVVKQGTGCRTCRSLLAAALFERQGSEWTLVADHRFLGAEGVYGAPPTVAVSFADKEAVELRVDRASADPMAVRELGSIIVLKGGTATRTAIARPEAVAKRVVAKEKLEQSEAKAPDSPFPSAGEAP